VRCVGERVKKNVGGSAFRELSENSFSKVAAPARRTPPVSRYSKFPPPPPSQVNSGEADPDDPDVG
jgi:hypothetical protein